MTAKKILLAGSVESNLLNLIKETYSWDQTFELEGNCDFNRYFFNIEEFKKEFNKGFHYIFCLEVLNPRPVTLNEDLKILSKLFSEKVLQQRLVVLFINLSDTQTSPTEIRETIVNSFNVMYKYIGISDQDEKKNFAQENIFLLLDSNTESKEFFNKLADINVEIYNPENNPETETPEFKTDKEETNS